MAEKIVRRREAEGRRQEVKTLISLLLTRFNPKLIVHSQE